MGSIEPTRAQLEALIADLDSEDSILMLNLLRFRDQAEYPDGFDAEPCTGAEAYGRYSEAVQPFLEGVGGRPVWAGTPRTAVIAPEGESWDGCFLVRYPSRQAFVNMATNPDYLAIAVHRTAALADSRLILCEDTPGAPDALGIGKS